MNFLEWAGTSPAPGLRDAGGRVALTAVCHDGLLSWIDTAIDSLPGIGIYAIVMSLILRVIWGVRP